MMLGKAGNELCMKTNHRRGFKANKPRFKKGRARFLKRSTIADVAPCATGASDASNGHRGLAASVAGAKKFVNSRFRFHEKAATRRPAAEEEQE